jgi:hypothetical protein
MKDELARCDISVNDMERMSRFDLALLLRDISVTDGLHLFFISDRNEGWWNIHRTKVNLNVSGSLTVDCVLRCVGREFGSAAWTFGHRSYDFLPEGKLFCTWADRDKVNCGVICNAMGSYVLDAGSSYVDENSRNESVVIAPFPSSESAPGAIASVDYVATDKFGNVYIIGGGPSVPSSVFKWESASDEAKAPFVKPLVETDGDFSESHVGKMVVLRSSISLSVDPDYISHPIFIAFPTACNGDPCEAHGIYYPPHNPKFRCSDETAKPPLLVKLHGGPTGKAVTNCRLDIQFFTSRGIAVLDVDYGGSTGYGRLYRKRMEGNWGVVDVEDCCRGAAYLAEKDLVDQSKLAIQGGSAGGYTALAAVAFRNVFRAATSSYGKQTGPIIEF